MPENPVIGGLYRDNYALPGTSSADSKRFRSRIAGLFRGFNKVINTNDVAQRLQETTGAKITFNGEYLVETWLGSANITDILSFLTVVHRGLHPPSSQLDWRNSVQMMLHQENLLYVVDAKGGIHPKVDDEFQRSVQSAVCVLDVAKFAAAKGAFEDAYNNLASSPPDYKGAVRNLFECVETLFRLGTGKELKSDHIRRELKSFVAARYSGSDPGTIQTADRFVEAFDRWVTAAHPYRHGHGSELPVDPPDELAIAEFSVGAGYVRWLAELFA